MIPNTDPANSAPEAADRASSALSALGVIDWQGLQRLMKVLQDRGYRIVGPTRQDDAIVYDDLSKAEDLPRGWTDKQSPGHYRLEKRDDEAAFGYAVGPHSYRRYFQVPVERLVQLRRKGRSFEVEPWSAPPSHLALFGARACEIAALGIQDRVLRDGAHVDPGYAARRRDVFVVAVHCGQAGGTCFCDSTGTGPAATTGFDLALTELLDAPGHRFLVAIGSPEGAAVYAELGAQPAQAADVTAAASIIDRTRQSMGRKLTMDGIVALLRDNPEHARWDDAAQRCLACGSCTLVCPTCFCTTVDDVTSLDGQSAERLRRYDSCFTTEHSYMHGGAVRRTVRSRYRQWLTHKLSSWVEQFGESGCVGCGRCMTWCPAAIDICEEVAAIGADSSHAQVRPALPNAGAPGEG